MQRYEPERIRSRCLALPTMASSTSPKLMVANHKGGGGASSFRHIMKSAYPQWLRFSTVTRVYAE
jgi:hypothetical protein